MSDSNASPMTFDDVVLGRRSIRGYLDKPVPREVIEGKLAEITDLARTYLGMDPVKDLVPIQPTAHYAMGGIPTDLNGLCLSDGNGGSVEGLVPDVVLERLHATLEARR